MTGCCLINIHYHITFTKHFNETNPAFKVILATLYTYINYRACIYIICKYINISLYTFNNHTNWVNFSSFGDHRKELETAIEFFCNNSTNCGFKIIAKQKLECDFYTQTYNMRVKIKEKNNITIKTKLCERMTEIIDYRHDYSIISLIDYPNNRIS